MGREAGCTGKARLQPEPEWEGRASTLQAPLVPTSEADALLTPGPAASCLLAQTPSTRRLTPGSLSLCVGELHSRCRVVQQSRPLAFLVSSLPVHTGHCRRSPVGLLAEAFGPLCCPHPRWARDHRTRIISFIMNVLSFISLGTVTVTTLKASSAPFNISGISGLVFMRCLFCSYLLLLETGLRFLLSSRPIILDHSLDFVDVLLWSLWIEAHRFSSFSQAILPV